MPPSKRGLAVAVFASLILLCAAPVYVRQNLAVVPDVAALSIRLGLRMGLGPRRVRIVWLGDSTTRNQISFLCDLLTRGPANASQPVFEWGTCAGRGFEITSAGNFGGHSQPWRMRDAGRLLDEHAKAQSASGTPSAGDDDAVRVVYFGSALLHAMHALPSVPYRGWPVFAGLDLAADMKAAVAQMRARGWHPIFHTVNWICDRASRTARAVRRSNSSGLCRARVTGNPGATAGKGVTNDQIECPNKCKSNTYAYSP
jgi:hypothetical protein